MSTNIISNAVPYEDLTCAECNYGAVDNEGLCMIDESHIAVAWTTELPQRDGYYFWRNSVKEELLELFNGLFYAESSRYGRSREDMALRRGQYLGPIQSRHFEELIRLRKSRHEEKASSAK